MLVPHHVSITYPSSAKHLAAVYFAPGSHRLTQLRYTLHWQFFALCKVKVHIDCSLWNERSRDETCPNDTWCQHQNQLRLLSVPETYIWNKSVVAVQRYPNNVCHLCTVNCSTHVGERGSALLQKIKTTSDHSCTIGMHLPPLLWDGGIGASGAKHPVASIKSIYPAARKGMLPMGLAAWSASQHRWDKPRASHSNSAPHVDESTRARTTCILYNTRKMKDILNWRQFCIFQSIRMIFLFRLFLLKCTLRLNPSSIIFTILSHSWSLPLLQRMCFQPTVNLNVKMREWHCRTCWQRARDTAAFVIFVSVVVVVAMYIYISGAITSCLCLWYC